MNMSRDRKLQMQNIVQYQRQAADAAAMSRALRAGMIEEFGPMLAIVQASWARSASVNAAIAQRKLFDLIDQIARERRYKAAAK